MRKYRFMSGVYDVFYSEATKTWRLEQDGQEVARGAAADLAQAEDCVGEVLEANYKLGLRQAVRVFLLKCPSGDDICVLAAGAEIRSILEDDPQFDDGEGASRAAAGLGRFFQVEVEVRHVPDHVIEPDDWCYDDCVAWLADDLSARTGVRHTAVLEGAA